MDYITSLGDSLDLIVMGGYFGEKKRATSGADWSDHISQFLLGVLSPAGSTFKAVPFARVGTGYSLQELTVLR